MSFNLATLIPAVQRAAAPPGLFETVYPEATDGDVLGTVMDAFAEAMLDGFFEGYSMDNAGLVTEDITLGEQALIVIYSTARLVETELRSRKSHIKYQTGTNIFEQDESATFLNTAFKAMQERKKELRTQSALGGSPDAMSDLFYIKSVYTYSDPSLVW